jgi:hypothetical protein
MIKADGSILQLFNFNNDHCTGRAPACLQADCTHFKVTGSVYPERDCDFRVPYPMAITVEISVMAQNLTVTVVIGIVTRIILSISIQSLIGSAIAGMVLAATTQDQFGLETASRCLEIRARFTI